MGRSTQLRRRLREAATIHPEERHLAATLSGALYLIGGATLSVMAAFTRYGDRHRGFLFALAAVAFGAGALAVTLPRRRHTSPGWIAHALQALSLTIVGAVVASTGGAGSPAWVYVSFPAFFTSYFYGAPIAAGYLLACVGVLALPLTYDPAARHGLFLAELVSTAPALLTLGLAMSAGKRRVLGLRERAETLAAEQTALRRVATAVAGGQSAEGIYAMVAAEVATLLSAGGAGILRHEDDGSLVVVGAYGERAGGTYEPGRVVATPPGSHVARALESGVTIRVDEHPAGAPVTRIGYRSSVVAPVTVGAKTWGLLAIGADEPMAFDARDEQTLLDFGDLLATAIASAEDRARLSEQALTDPLTGLANQRALDARLAVELARAARHGGPLAVAMIDIDHFKEINDSAGHEVGDEMLVRVGRALAGFARAEDILARVGGDEFAWVLPDTTREQALVAVERARGLIATSPPDPLAITISAGICDLDSSSDPGEVVRLADTALYWSKAHGRNQSWIYDPAVIGELSDQERAERLERAAAVEGLRALVRDREARDPATREHSERVAALALALAERAGWSRERALLLGEAARMHDIAIIAGGEGAATRDGLDANGLVRRRAAAARSAEIVSGMLDGEQVRWIRDQYAPPADAVASTAAVETVRLEAGEPVSGASLLALADAWDCLTAVTPGLPAQALAECERLAGTVFDRRAVETLAALLHARGLGGPPAASDAVGG